ncbi:protein O-mannose kinase-like [Ptychodera flava]|uniref:protein O-mannose kinase-like n=1 Tax=Ptychodera flava TaxID=63121 RepID=UPI003969E4DB
MKLIWRYVSLLFSLCICCYFILKSMKSGSKERAPFHGNTLLPDGHGLSELTCRQRERIFGVQTRRLQACNTGHFSLPGMEDCHAWLTCDDIDNNVHIKKPIGHGAVKRVYFAEWKGFKVAYCNLTTEVFREDFRHGLKMIKLFQPYDHVVQLVGYCGDAMVLEYHPWHSADNLNQILSRSENEHLNTVLFRFILSINYVEIIHFLHTHPAGVHVMCDSNDIVKTLSQFLIRSDFQLILSDLDALPRIDPEQENLIKCGHRQLFGNFVAPEQLWPYDDRDFDDDEMPGYDEKTDIWKIPSVVQFILGDVPGSDVLWFHLFKVHRRCREVDPRLRPNTQEILDEYMQIYISLYSS